MMHGLKPLSLVKRTDLKGSQILFLLDPILSHCGKNFLFPLKTFYLKIFLPLFLLSVLYPQNVDLIVFDRQSSQRMRQNLKTLVEETTRQQNVIQELIETNQQLK